jgi:hypothetical protein
MLPAIFGLLFDALAFVASYLLILLAGVVAVHLNIAAYARIRLLGYFPPAAAFLVLGVDAVAILAVISILLLSSDYLGNFSVTLCIISISTLIFVAFGSAVLVRNLPKRRDSTRLFGTRRVRFPFTSLGCLIIAGSIAGGAAMIYFDPTQIFWPVFLALIPAMWGAYSIVYGRSIRNPPTIEDALKSDARLPVLYLRPFRAESAAFVLRNAGSGRSARIESVRFDDHLKPAIEGRIGPFVALGNPEDYFPHLGGAVHTYADDEGWYERFERLAGRAACTVMRVSDSNNLKRELTFIRREGLQRRLFIFTNTMKAKPGSYRARLESGIAWLSSRLYGPLPANTGATTAGSGEASLLLQHLRRTFGLLELLLQLEVSASAV